MAMKVSSSRDKKVITMIITKSGEKGKVSENHQEYRYEIYPGHIHGVLSPWLLCCQFWRRAVLPPEDQAVGHSPQSGAGPLQSLMLPCPLPLPPSTPWSASFPSAPAGPCPAALRLLVEEAADVSSGSSWRRDPLGKVSASLCWRLVIFFPCVCGFFFPP